MTFAWYIKSLSSQYISSFLQPLFLTPNHSPAPTMGLRDRIKSALTGTPDPADSTLTRLRRDGRSNQLQRTSQGSAHPFTSMTTVRGRASQLAVEGSSTASQSSRLQPQQLAIEGRSDAVNTRASRQNRSTTSSANADAASTRAILGPTLREPALPLTRISRPYGSTGNQEAFTLDPSRRPTFESSRRTSIAGAPSASRIRSGDEENPLPHLSEREIVDVSDENHAPAIGVNPRRSVTGETRRNPFQQPGRASKPIPPAAIPQRGGPSTRTPPSARLGTQSAGSTTAGQPRSGIAQTPSRRDTASQPPSRPQTSFSAPAQTTPSFSAHAERPQCS